jgi:simple sugar transport system ATP-binding protein
MNVRYGLYDRDAGTITLQGEPFDPRSPADAIDSGVGMVHQHFMLVPRLTVAENVVLGDRRQAGRATRWAEGLCDRFASTARHERFVAAGVRERLESVPGVERLASIPVGVGDALTLDMETPTRRIRELTEEYGLEVPPEAPVRELTVGERQRVESLKALFRDVELLVLDEPTAVLAPDDAERLSETLEGLADSGITIIFITHKLAEVTRLTDRVTVLRDGERIDTVETDTVTEDDLARLMVGRDVLFDVERPAARVGDPVLEATGLETEDDRGFEVLSGVDLSVRAGEVVGIAGVSGNGQVDLAESLVGVHQPAAGSIHVGGRDRTGEGPRAFLDAGVAYVPEDRLEDATAPDLSVLHNLMLKSYRAGTRAGPRRTRRPPAHPRGRRRRRRVPPGGGPRPARGRDGRRSRLGESGRGIRTERPHSRPLGRGDSGRNHPGSGRPEDCGTLDGRRRRDLARGSTLESRTARGARNG